LPASTGPFDDELHAASANEQAIKNPDAPLLKCLAPNSVLLPD
jgi:hypothetical protein